MLDLFIVDLYGKWSQISLTPWTKIKKIRIRSFQHQRHDTTTDDRTRTMVVTKHKRCNMSRRSSRSYSSSSVCGMVQSCLVAMLLLLTTMTIPSVAADSLTTSSIALLQKASANKPSSFLLPLLDNHHQLSRVVASSQDVTTTTTTITSAAVVASWQAIPRGGGWIVPAGWNPFGYKITALGEKYLQFDGSLQSDVGRFLASLKSARKTAANLKAQWLEIVRVSKEGQAMRVYRQLKDLLDFCVQAGLID